MDEYSLSREFMELKKTYMEQLSILHYCAGSIKNYSCVFAKLEHFMEKHGAAGYTIGIGEAFLEEMAVLGNPSKKIVNATVRRLNEMMETGIFSLREKHDEAKHVACFSKQMDDYVEHMRIQGFHKSTISKYNRSLVRVLKEFHDRGVRDLSTLRPVDIYAAFEKSSYKQGFSTPVRNFLKYLNKKGLHGSDLSLIVPTVRMRKPVPSIYTGVEVEKILLEVDRSTALGKRDYAAIMLALRLGMRGGDILNLKISDLDFNAKKIEFIQEKTLVPQRLELLPEIEEALASYLLARMNPQCSPYVFLTEMAPYSPLQGNAVWRAVAKHIAAADIDAGNRKRGSHALRSTLASELAAENVPHNVIRKILGHENPDAIRNYVKLDIELLRKCALDVPQPSGLLAQKFKAKSGGDAQ